MKEKSIAGSISTTHYGMNRPVHLGRCAAFIEKASSLFIQKCLKEKQAKKQVQYVEEVLYYLQSALEHADFALKSEQSNPFEQSFISFAHLMISFLHSAHTVIENEIQLKNTSNTLEQFIHFNSPDDSKPFYWRGSKHLLNDVSQLFHVLNQMYSYLEKTLNSSMTDHDRSRYERARHALLKHISSRSHQQHALTSARTFYPFLARKYE